MDKKNIYQEINLILGKIKRLESDIELLNKRMDSIQNPPVAIYKFSDQQRDFEDKFSS